MKEFAPYFALVGAALVLLGGSALAALFWAAKSGQFQSLEESSKTIFDPDEPEGEVTDTFPSVKKSYRSNRTKSGSKK